MIQQRGVYRKLCNANDTVMLKKMYGRVRRLRVRLKQGGNITIDHKIKLLLRYGWRPGDELFTKKEVVAILDLCIRMNKEARSMGGAFCFEQAIKKLR